MEDFIGSEDERMREMEERFQALVDSGLKESGLMSESEYAAFVERYGETKRRLEDELDTHRRRLEHNLKRNGEIE